MTYCKVRDMKTIWRFIKAIPSFWRYYKDYEYDGEVCRHITETLTTVVSSRTRTMSKPTYYAIDIIDEIDRYYEYMYEEG